MKISRLASILALVTAMSGCKVSVGDGNFDGSFFDDEDGSVKRDAGKNQRDAGKPKTDDDGGLDDEDSGKAAPASDAGKTPSKDAGMTAVSPSDLPGLFAKAVCGAYEACMGPVRLLEFLKGTECVNLITRQQSERGLHGLSDSIDKGRVLFRSARLDDCLAALTAYGCDVQSRRLPAACEDALEGQQRAGTSCSIDYDCASDAYCDKGISTEACPGTCRSPQGEGLSCKASAECEDRLICRSGKCTAPLKEAESCEQVACPAGLVCLGATGSRKCQSLGAYSMKLDQACDAYGPLCEVGLVCASQSSANTAGLCKQPVSKDGVCRRAVPNQCPSTQYCKTTQSGSIDRAAPGADGVCADLPLDGGSCMTLSCGPGTVCGSMSEICHALKMAGGTCEDSAECYSGSCESGICTLGLTCSL